MNTEREAFARRLHNYWTAASAALSQGGDHMIVVDPTFMEDLYACEILVRMVGSKTDAVVMSEREC